MEAIIGVMLFGSSARGDSDEHSDKDIFVLCKNVEYAELLDTKRIVETSLQNSASACTYRLADAMKMASQGSLFMWHLKLQGKTVFSKGRAIERVLEAIVPYGGFQQDLELYGTLLDDVKTCYSRNGYLNEFDLSLLFTIVRNICIVLCYREGQPKFGRSNAYLAARRLFPKTLPLSANVYPMLCAHKLWYERGVKLNPDAQTQVQEVIDEVEELLEFAKRMCL